jgi:putative DNA primase/helicase
MAVVTADFGAGWVSRQLPSADPAADEGAAGPLPPPSEPAAVARVLVDRHHREPDGTVTLRAWRGGFHRWAGGCWVEAEEAAIRAWLYRQVEHATYEHPKYGPMPWAPTRHKIADLTDALRAVTHLDEHVNPPAWLDDAVSDPPAGELVAMGNGLLHVRTRKLHPHTPQLFNRVAVPFDYDPNASEPARWVKFLKDLWPEDPDPAAALAEFFGYVLSGETRLHKILLAVGPTRSGKGTIARVLGALVGAGNVAGPTLASLGTNFGLAPLIGKPLAVISDARLGGPNVHVVVERLLSVSGQDRLTVDRKYREPWTGTLGTRLFVISNELPRFGDASGAIANRFIVLVATRSWLGAEDPGLTDQLLAELPGILGWALDGLERLQRNGHFTEPASSTDAVIALQDLASPVSAFVRDRCTVGTAHEVLVDELYAAWKSWCEEHGRSRPGSAQMFGRDLRAALPGVRMVRPRVEEGRERRYVGVRLAELTVSGTADHRGPGVVRNGPRPIPLLSQQDAARVRCSQCGGTAQFDPQSAHGRARLGQGHLECGAAWEPAP